MKLSAVAVIVCVTAWTVACSPQRGSQPDAGVPAPPCERDHIRKIYAIPGNLFVPETTTIELEVFDDAIEGEPRVAFAIAPAWDAVGEATLAPAAECAPDSAACQNITCVGVGTTTERHRSGLPLARVRVQVAIEDDVCRQTSDIFVECLQASDEQTCDICLGLIEPAVDALPPPEVGRALLEAAGLSPEGIAACKRACY